MSVLVDTFENIIDNFLLAKKTFSTKKEPKKPCRLALSHPPLRENVGIFTTILFLFIVNLR